MRADPLLRMMLAGMVASTVSAHAAISQTRPNRPDSALMYNEAKRLSAQADSLGKGSAEDRQRAVDFRRRAGDRYQKAGAMQDAGGAFLEAGRGFHSMGQLDSAMSYYRAALPLLRAAGNQAAAGRILANIGVIHLSIGQPDSAIAYFRQAAPMMRLAGDQQGEAAILLNTGNLYVQLSQPDSALAYYRRALPATRAIGDRENEAAALANMGIVFGDIGLPDSAMAYYRQALPIQKAISDHEGEAGTLGNIGTVFLRTGQSDSALAYNHQALRIDREFRIPAGEQATLMNLGVLFQNLGQTDSALAYYRLALPIQRGLGDRPHEAGTLNNIGAAFTLIHQLDSALVYYLQALPIKVEVGDRVGEAGTLANIGTIHRMSGRPDSALAYYHRALPIQRAAGYRADEAETLFSIGIVFSDLDQGDSALTHYHQAVAIRHELGIRAGEAETLANIGDLYRRIKRPDSAVVYYDRATALHAAVSSQAGSDFNRLSYNDTFTYWYGAWTLAWLAQVDSNVGNARRPDRLSTIYGSLAASERGRAQALLDLMRDTTVSFLTGTDFPAEGIRFATQFRNSRTAGLVYATAGDTLVTWLLHPAGDARVFRKSIPRDSLSALVEQFRLQLGVGRGADRLAARGSDLELMSESAANSRSTSGDRGSELAALLLPTDVLAELKNLKEVVVVPQGSIALVPFAALPVGDTDRFGDNLAIRYAPSLATLVQAESRPAPASGSARTESLKRALVVGNPLMPEVPVPGGSERLIPLPGAQTEGRDIATQLGGESLTGPAATESEIVRRLTAAPLVHLATHGFAYSAEARARNSFVALAPDSTNDGLLTVGEILDNTALRLIADLVALSACQTGLGNLKESEGTVGLQRAFLAKGARSVLVSLWNISDDATAALMSGFYRHWLRDRDQPSKAEALRRSQEEVRRRKGWEDPRFWAGFQLVGAR